MGGLLRTFCLLAVSMLTMPVCAASGNLIGLAAGTVQALQAPAWLVRDGRPRALRPGTELRSADTVRTGRGGVVRLELADGSTVKLGPEAVMNLTELTAPPEPSGTFRGVLDLVRGAFRFTTAALGATRKRRVDARVGAMTIGIRGTDVWGEATPERDFTVLLEGQVEVTTGTSKVTLDRPNSLFVSPAGAAPLPVTQADPTELARWAATTELTSSARGGHGTIEPSGGWAVVLVSVPRTAEADAFVNWVEREGYPAQRKRSVVGGRTWQRVYVAGLASRAEAKALRDHLALTFGVPDAWIVRARTL